MKTTLLKTILFALSFGISLTTYAEQKQNNNGFFPFPEVRNPEPERHYEHSHREYRDGYEKDRYKSRKWERRKKENLGKVKPYWRKKYRGRDEAFTKREYYRGGEQHRRQYPYSNPWFANQFYRY